MRRLMGLGAVLLVMAALSAAGAPRARADLPVPELEVGFENNVPAGRMIALAAWLSDPAGNPIPGAEVIFTAETTFLNNTGDAELGRAVTDSNGLAELAFEPRIEGERQISARFAGDEVFMPVKSTEVLMVLPGPRLHLEPGPVRIPGANVGMAASVLAVVWGVFLFTLVALWRIARIGEREARGSNG